MWLGTDAIGGPAAIKIVTDAAKAAAERASLTRLNHPCIVRLLDGGVLGAVAAKSLSAAEAQADAEAHAAGTRKHPGPTSATAIKAEDSWLAIRHAKGGTLEACRARMSAADVAAILRSLLSALIHAHARGVLHLDVKPANVLLSHVPDVGNPASVLLCDFGIADVAGRAARSTPMGGSIYRAGTPGFQSEEQSKRDGWLCGPWSDLASVGKLGWWLVNPDTAEIQPGQPFRAWLDMLASPDPSNRPRTARRALDALDALDLPESVRIAGPASASPAASDVVGAGVLADHVFPLVGRAVERAHLEGAVRAGLGGTPHLISVFGPPRVGRSRLIDEVLWHESETRDVHTLTLEPDRVDGVLVPTPLHVAIGHALTAFVGRHLRDGAGSTSENPVPYGEVFRRAERLLQLHGAPDTALSAELASSTQGAARTLEPAFLAWLRATNVPTILRVRHATKISGAGAFAAQLHAATRGPLAIIVSGEREDDALTGLVGTRIRLDPFPFIVWEDLLSDLLDARLGRVQEIAALSDGLFGRAYELLRHWVQKGRFGREKPPPRGARSLPVVGVGLRDIDALPPAWVTELSASLDDCVPTWRSNASLVAAAMAALGSPDGVTAALSLVTIGANGAKDAGMQPLVAAGLVKRRGSTFRFTRGALPTLILGSVSDDIITRVAEQLLAPPPGAATATTEEEAGALVPALLVNRLPAYEDLRRTFHRLIAAQQFVWADHLLDLVDAGSPDAPMVKGTLALERSHVLRARGRPEDARAHAEAAMGFANAEPQASASERGPLEAWALFRRALAERAMTPDKNTLDHLKLALATLERSRPDAVLQHSIGIEFASLFRQYGWIDEARLQIDQTIAVTADTLVEVHARALLFRALLNRPTHPQLAMHDAAILLRLGGADRPGLTTLMGRAWSSLGNAWRAAGQREDARQAMASALSALREGEDRRRTELFAATLDVLDPGASEGDLHAAAELASRLEVRAARHAANATAGFAAVVGTLARVRVGGAPPHTTRRLVDVAAASKIGPTLEVVELVEAFGPNGELPAYDVVYQVLHPLAEDHRGLLWGHRRVGRSEW